MKFIPLIPLLLLLLVMGGAVAGWLRTGTGTGTNATDQLIRVSMEPDAPGAKHDTLFVVVHGLRGPQALRASVVPVLRGRGDVAVLTYSAGLTLNADPYAIAAQLSNTIQGLQDKTHYSKIVVVAHSMGALLARQAYLHAADNVSARARPWNDGTTPVRLVLLAGMNRGWDLSGQKPADMRWYSFAWYSFGTWLAKLTGSGQLVMSMEAGAPFVAGLRLDWMRAAHDNKPMPETVQLLGDIDELVSNADDKDIRVAASDKFTWLLMRGTGHDSILDFTETASNLGAYRREKFIAAIDLKFEQVRSLSEELPYNTDPDVKTIVFIVHGIRDLGEWSSQFEDELRKNAPTGPHDKLAIASIRYGYFGMGQFLLRVDRQKYVRWFMDQYTETLARYPNARSIEFVGHSNGTYLLTSALEHYPALKIHRVVLAGSVARTTFDWHGRFITGQVTSVRNYTADNDWVVALFPRFFETPGIAALHNDIGSAGFNGFDAAAAGPDRGRIENIAIAGMHSAFVEHIPEIVDYVLHGSHAGMRPGGAVQPSPWLKMVSTWLIWPIWAGLIVAVVWTGSRVLGAAGELGWLAVGLYVVLLYQVLRWT